MKQPLACLLAITIHSPAVAEPTIAEAVGQAQRVLEDPRNEKVMNSVLESLADALLAMPAGDIAAAAEGRVASPVEKKLTVRDIARREDPQFEVKLKSRIAQSGPALHQSMKSLAQSLPALAKSLEDAGKAIERAAANMPDPTYPKR